MPLILKNVCAGFWGCLDAGPLTVNCVVVAKSILVHTFTATATIVISSHRLLVDILLVDIFTIISLGILAIERIRFFQMIDNVNVGDGILDNWTSWCG